MQQVCLWTQSSKRLARILSSIYLTKERQAIQVSFLMYPSKENYCISAHFQCQIREFQKCHCATYYSCRDCLPEIMLAFPYTDFLFASSKTARHFPDILILEKIETQYYYSFYL